MKCLNCKTEKCKFISKKKAKQRRNKILDILKKANKSLKEIKRGDEVLYSGFSAIQVGSAKRSIIYQRGNSEYDLDFQLLFAREKDYPLSLKSDLRDVIDDCSSSDWSVKISTSVIELKNDKEKWFYDLAILHLKDGDTKILKGKDNDYYWGDLKEYSNKLNSFKGNNTIKIKDEYKKLKCINWDKTNNNKNHEDYKPSISLLIEAINNVG